MRGVLVLLLVGLCGGCFGEQIREQAQHTASLDHGCPQSRVVLITDATVGNDYAYWFDVCGQRRYYRYQQTSDIGIGSGRFLDETNRMNSSGGQN